MYNYTVLKYYKIFQKKKNYKITSSCEQKNQINTTKWFLNIKKKVMLSLNFFFLGWKNITYESCVRCFSTVSYLCLKLSSKWRQCEWLSLSAIHEIERWRTMEGSRDDYLFGLWRQCHFSQISKTRKKKKTSFKNSYKTVSEFS